FFWERTRAMAHQYRRSSLAQTWASHVTAANSLLERVGNALIQHHHSVGFVNDSTAYAHMDMEGGLCAVTQDNNGTRTNGVKYVIAATMAALEGRDVARAVGSPYDTSAPAGLSYHVSLYYQYYVRWFGAGGSASIGNFDDATAAGV